MEFHGNIHVNFMEFHEKFHGIPLNPMEFSTEFHGIFHKHLTNFFMKIFHGIPWKISWNSMEYSMEFHGKFHEFTERFLPGLLVNFTNA
jgi:hypothetical protein